MRFSTRRSEWWLAFLLLFSFLPGRAAAQDDFDEFDDFDSFEEPVKEKPAAATPAGAAEETAASLLDSEELREQRFRLHGTVDGIAGGVRTVDAGSAPAGTFRTQLSLDFFMADGYLERDDNNDYLGGALSVNWTVLDFLEVYAAITSSANANDKEQPELFQVLGDTTLGGKAFYPVNPWLTMGGDLRLALLNSVGGIGPSMKGTGFGLRGNASADFRRVEGGLPLIVRFNLDYFFDNSSNVIEEIEQQRFESLDSDYQDPAYEYRQLLSRVERFALGINRVDLLTFALGIEAPLKAATDFFVHPILEWNLGIPINRQGYSCLYDSTDVQLGGDSCLERAGAGAFPQTLTLGVRAYPPLRGVALLAAVDIGLTGTTEFVRELAPTKPYDVIFALSFAYDARKARPVVREVEAARGAAPYKGLIRGQVVEEGTGSAVAEALVTYPGRDLTAQQTDREGRFLSYELEPGEVELEITHPDYETGFCRATIPPASVPGAKGRAGASLTMEDFTDEFAAYPDEATGEKPAAPGGEEPEDSATDRSPQQSREVELTCALRPRPRKAGLNGLVTSSSGLPLGGASIELQGPEPARAVSQPSGRFAFEQVEPGFYTLRAEAEGCFIKQQSVELAAGETASVQLVLMERPATSLVRVTGREIRLRRRIDFLPGTAQIDPASEPLLAEVADVLVRSPEIGLVEVGAHTDNQGAPAHNLELSQQRAEAVRDRLVENGVSPERLEAKGYGEERPLVPNLTAANRARNRRVQLLIRK